MAVGLAHEQTLWQDQQRVAGIDEAGRGAWAGPVVAAAVILPPHPKTIFRQLHEVDDSKRLSPRTRARLAEIIIELAEVGIGEVSPQEIDHIGILAATMKAMALAVSALRPPPTYLLIDFIPRPLGSWPQARLVGGDTVSLSIAAASIIAKVSRDRMLEQADQIWPGYAFASHKGYGTVRHRAAITDLGPCPYHRRSWRPFRQPPLPLAFTD